MHEITNLWICSVPEPILNSFRTRTHSNHWRIATAQHLHSSQHSDLFSSIISPDGRGPEGAGKDDRATPPQRAAAHLPTRSAAGSAEPRAGGGKTRSGPATPQRGRRRPLTLWRSGRCERRGPGLLPAAASPRQEGPRQEQRDAEHQAGDRGHPAARRGRHGGRRAAVTDC